MVVASSYDFHCLCRVTPLLKLPSRYFCSAGYTHEMAENQTSKSEYLRRNIAFIQQSIAAGGLATVAGYLLQFELITRQNHDDALAPCGRGPVDQAAMLMRNVELKIESDPDLYFPRFTQALWRSNLGHVAAMLEQELARHDDQCHSTCEYVLSTHMLLIESSCNCVHVDWLFA